LAQKKGSYLGYGGKGEWEDGQAHKTNGGGTVTTQEFFGTSKKNQSRNQRKAEEWLSPGKTAKEGTTYFDQKKKKTKNKGRAPSRRFGLHFSSWP